MYGLCRVRSSAIEGLAALMNINSEPQSGFWVPAQSRSLMHWRRDRNAENEAFWGHYVPNNITVV